jgi:hypothetical protein
MPLIAVVADLPHSGQLKNKSIKEKVWKQYRSLLLGG